MIQNERGEWVWNFANSNTYESAKTQAEIEITKARILELSKNVKQSDIQAIKKHNELISKAEKV